MSNTFKVGDHVRWNSEAGHVSGTITKVHTRDTDYKGHTRHASRDEPQYEIKSDKTDHIAMHKGWRWRRSTNPISSRQGRRGYRGCRGWLTADGSSRTGPEPQPAVVIESPVMPAARRAASRRRCGSMV